MAALFLQDPRKVAPVNPIYIGLRTFSHGFLTREQFLQADPFVLIHKVRKRAIDQGLWLLSNVFVCACVCVCVRERGSKIDS